MKRMKCRHRTVLPDGLPNVYIQVGPKEDGGLGFDGCMMCLDGGIAFYEAGVEAARASMVRLLEGVAIGHDPEGRLYKRDREAAENRLKEESK